MEKTRIKISYKHNTKEGNFQVPDLMITKEWYNPENNKVSFAEVLYREDKQVSEIFEEKYQLTVKKI